MKTENRSLRLLGICTNILFGAAVMFCLSVFFVGESRLIPPSLFTAEGRAKRAEIESILTTVDTVSEASAITVMAPHDSTLRAMSHDRWEELSEEALASASTDAEREAVCNDAPYDVKYSDACMRVYKQQELAMIESLSG
jgi:hypothetical protein